MMPRVNNLEKNLLITLGPQAHISRYQESGNIEVSGNIDAQQVYAHLLGVRRVRT
jgi:hypothetical protein